MRKKIVLIASSVFLMASPAAAQSFGETDFLKSADANGDGVITREECRDWRVARFDQLDRNKDGVISREDFPRFSMLPKKYKESLNEMIRSADANGDGKVTREELRAAPSRIFDRLDTNNDGKLDRDEIAAARR